MPPKLNRPAPLLRPAAKPVDRSTPAGQAAERLLRGEKLVVTDLYNTGTWILAELEARLGPPAPDAGYPARRAWRKAYGEVSRRLLAPIVGHRVDLREAPTIGFLRELYPEHRDFALPFVELQDLDNAWNWYRDGVHLAVLGHRVHPFYGTYAPARVTHLELFATWLSQYQGRRARAIDVGTGCGVLALLLCKAGFARVRATDINPNAIESVRRELARLPTAPRLDLYLGDLLGDDRAPVDLVVFNPPWMQGAIDSQLDQALYFEEGLFERFFDQAHARLAPEGRIALVFSNLIELVQPDTAHPILAELRRGRFGLVQKLQRKVRNPPGPTGQRGRSTRERVEIWELERK